MDKGRLQALAELHRAGKTPGVKAALKVASETTPPAPKFPTGAPPPPTSPDAPFGITDPSATAVAMFILRADARRRAGCPAPEPTNEAAKFIVETVAKLRERV